MWNESKEWKNANWNERWITSIIRWKFNDMKLINFKKNITAISQN